MSATLPKLDKLETYQSQTQNFVYLLPDSKKRYFKNPNFAGRVSFEFDLFDRNDLHLEELKEKVLEESLLYAAKDLGTAKPVNSVFTIIEFIFKKTASQFYELFEDASIYE